VVGSATKHLARLNIPFAIVLDKPARADSELCGVVHDRLIDSKLKGNVQFDPLDDGCGKFAISNLRQAGFQMRDSFLHSAEEIVENFISTFAADPQSEAVDREAAHDERTP
jgi:hypothetical protein